MIKSGWSIVHIGGQRLQVLINVHVFLSLKIDFVLTNSVHTVEMPHYHLGLLCLPKYPFRGVWSTNSLNDDLPEDK